MSYHLRRPIQWRDRDTDTISMVIKHIGHSIISPRVYNNPNMPEMIRREDIEDDYISWLPLFESILIIRDNRIREDLRRSREVYLKSLHTSIVDIRVEVSFIEKWMLFNIFLERGTKINSDIPIRSPDHIGTDTSIWWRKTAIAVVSISMIIGLHDSYLFFCLFEKKYGSCRSCEGNYWFFGREYCTDLSDERYIRCRDKWNKKSFPK